MIYRILVCITFYISSSFIISSDKYIEQDSTMIPWSSKRLLTWKDFKGPPKKNRGRTVAETHGRIMLESTSTNNEIPHLVVTCFFLTNKSWTIVNDDDTLQHEQLHFNLYEFYTRNIRRAFKVLNQQGETDFKKYKEVFNYYTKENDRMNNQYDKEVYDNLEKQREWALRISSALEKTRHLELK